MNKFHYYTEEKQKENDANKAKKTNSSNIGKTLRKYLQRYKPYLHTLSRDEFRDFAFEYYYTFATQFSRKREKERLLKIIDEVYDDDSCCFVKDSDFYKKNIKNKINVELVQSIKKKLLEIQEKHKNDTEGYFSPTELTTTEYSSNFYWRAVNIITEIKTKDWRFNKQIDKKQKRYMKMEALPVVIAALDDWLLKNDKNYQSISTTAQTQNVETTGQTTTVIEPPKEEKKPVIDLSKLFQL